MPYYNVPNYDWYVGPREIPALPWGRVPVVSARGPKVTYIPGYRGYRGYVSPEVLKRPVNVGAVGVGIAAAAGTLALGLIATSIGKQDSPKKDILPLTLPALGAGFVAYLLRWQLDRCPCEPEAPVPPPMEIEIAERERPAAPARAITCPEGQYWDERARACLDIPI